MAKATNNTGKPKKIKKAKGEGQIAQIIQVFKMTVKFDRKNLWILLAAFFLPLIAGVLAGVLLDGGWLGIVLWSLTGLMAGLLITMILLGNRAQNAAYRQLEGQEGAVGAVMKNLRGKWQASEMPVAVSPRTRDAIYRAIGKPGVVLVVDGQASRMTKLISDEERKVLRVVPNIPVEVIVVGDGEDKVRLYKLPKTLKHLPKRLGKHEIRAVYKRLASLTPNSPVSIPKGIDPFKVRPQRPR
ncbi:MAG: DUF4191 domain-containing protein [Microbacteriaceae bacterium]